MVRQDCRQFANGPVKWRLGNTTLAHTIHGVSNLTEHEVTVPSRLAKIPSSVSGAEEKIRLLKPVAYPGILFGGREGGFNKFS